jgi:hypothetical protein
MIAARLRPMTLALALTAALSGCMGWSPAVTPTPVERAAPVRMQVWSGAARYDLRDAQWAGDTLVGRPADQPDALVRLPRAAVDSVRVRRLRPGATFATAAGVTIGTNAAILATLFAVWVSAVD